MTSASAGPDLPDERPPASNQIPDLPAQDGHDIGLFVGALAIVLRETIGRFEQVSSHITDIVQPARASRELIVAFQEFDRLQQEFSALSSVLDHFAQNVAGLEHKHNGHHAIEAISIANVKERLVRYMSAPPADLSPEESKEVVF
jgi:hypothetical protein